MFEKLSKRAQEVIAMSAKSGLPTKPKEEFPDKLKTQLAFIWKEIAKSFVEVMVYRDLNIIFGPIRERLQAKLGLPQLAAYHLPPLDDFMTFFYEEKDLDECLTIITIVFDTLVELSKKGMDNRWDENRAILNGIEQMNEAFRQNKVSYQFREGRFIRMDAGFIHEELTAPVFELLREPYLKGANDEFAKAHNDFRERRYSDCIIECCKAFESTMKSICHKRGWFYEQKDVASVLVQRCKDNGLFPVFMESHMSSLVTTLTSGVPTARNKTGSHGKLPFSFEDRW